MKYCTVLVWNTAQQHTLIVPMHSHKIKGKKMKNMDWHHCIVTRKNKMYYKVKNIIRSCFALRSAIDTTTKK